MIALVLSFITKDTGWVYTFRLAAICLSFILLFEPDKNEYLNSLKKEYFKLTERNYIDLPTKYFETKDIYSIASAPTVICGLLCGYLLRPELTGVTGIISSFIGLGFFAFMTNVRDRVGLSARALSLAKEEAEELLRNQNS